MGRLIVGIMVGILIAVATVFVIESIVQVVYPPPGGFNMRDPEAVRARVASVPSWVILLVLVGWVVGTWLGSWAAVRLGRTTMRWPGLAVGAVIFANTVYNLVTIPHPVWFASVALLGIPIASWLGARAASRRPLPAPAA